jgi:hypothetical protein
MICTSLPCAYAQDSKSVRAAAERHGQDGVAVEQVIAECAERIIALLGSRGEVNLLRLSELLTERSLITYQALGWLARDGRVLYAQRGNQFYVRARPPQDDGSNLSAAGRLV